MGPDQPGLKAGRYRTKCPCFLASAPKRAVLASEPGPIKFFTKNASTEASAACYWSRPIRTRATSSRLATPRPTSRRPRRQVTRHHSYREKDAKHSHLGHPLQPTAHPPLHESHGTRGARQNHRHLLRSRQQHHLAGSSLQLAAESTNKVAMRKSPWGLRRSGKS